MKRSQLSAQALAAWTLNALQKGEYSLARQELPEVDLRTFFDAFAEAKDIPGPISLALVGFGPNDADAISGIAKKAGVTCFGSFAADLHAAAGWRNDRAKHPIIVAYARGKTPGVNTLRHFTQATSQELTVTLL